MRLAPLLIALTVSVVVSAPVSLAVAPAATVTSGPTAPGTTAGADVSVANPANPANGTLTNHTNQSRILAVPEPAVQTTTLRSATLDLGPATEFSGNLTAVRMETAAIESYIDGAEESEERQRRIRASLRDVEQEADALRERRQAAIQAYNRDEISTEEFLVELATVGARAEAYEVRVATLQQSARETDDWTEQEESRVKSRIESVRYQLRALGGPVSDRAAAAIRGTAPTTRVFVTTGPQGYELSTITNGTYVREAFRGAVRENNRSASLTPSTAADVVGQSYPIISKHGGDPGVIGSGTTYVVTVPRNGSTLTAFVDSESERVFKEYQRIPLEEFHDGSTETNVKSGLRLTVNRSYPGGPVRVSVTDAETGEPADTTITIAQNGGQGVVVGRTGDDGVLWTLSPRGGYTVFASREGQAASGFVETNSTLAPEIE